MPLRLCWQPPPLRQRVSVRPKPQPRLRGRGRESLDFTLKRNRAERVQIVNGGSGGGPAVILPDHDPIQSNRIMVWFSQLEPDFFGKPVPTFPDHAPGSQAS